MTSLSPRFFHHGAGVVRRITCGLAGWLFGFDGPLFSWYALVDGGRLWPVFAH